MLAFACVNQGPLLKVLKRHFKGPRTLMLTLLSLVFSQKWDRFLLAMGELRKPLTIIPLTTCPLS